MLDGNTLIFEADYQSEGQKWHKISKYTLVENNTMLYKDENLIRVRCPNQ